MIFLGYKSFAFSRNTFTWFQNSFLEKPEDLKDFFYESIRWLYSPKMMILDPAFQKLFPRQGSFISDLAYRTIFWRFPLLNATTTS